MTKHFTDRDTAIADLKTHGFRQLSNGRWVNNVCTAHILTHAKSPTVAVQYWETPIFDHDWNSE